MSTKIVKKMTFVINRIKETHKKNEAELIALGFLAVEQGKVVPTRKGILSVGTVREVE
ncbi:hypothetical protein BegalDRAFT_1457 [Beggiatoa alba B18LD]|uniref:Uncharacterized protein n=1 Tax=Beggiatoa alba B18LD TaxID=395493 RepID=I3CFF2_9GAMM|nr:hypothetical protein [Beggiatoa alba]EIJ42345.1 hypothetical protein BegalDRAFT_1457 [Beggiatoa alba B18LD]